ncbi:hypothetical protein C6V05_03115 [Burkholderia multivorans]|nr:hypothetical protein C6V05_03115 [Burkholderia multivorans]
MRVFAARLLRHQRGETPMLSLLLERDKFTRLNYTPIGRRPWCPLAALGFLYLIASAVAPDLGL